MPDIGLIAAIVATPDGKILVAGEKAVAKVNADLTPDTTFGTAGLVSLDQKRDEDTIIHAMTLDASGRILVAAEEWPVEARRQDLVVARLTPAGVLDETFGRGGRVVRDLGNTDDRPASVFALPAGEIVVIGVHQQAQGSELYNAYLARFDDRGKPGKVVFFDVIRAAGEFVTDALLDERGFLVAGYAPESGGTTGYFTARLRADGTLDPAGTKHVSDGDLGSAVVWHLTVVGGETVIAGDAGGAANHEKRCFVARLPDNVVWCKEFGTRISMIAPDGDGVLAVRKRPGALMQFPARGEIAVTEGREDDVYDAGAVLANGDVVVATYGLLVRWSRR